MVFKFEIDTKELNDSNPDSIEQTIKDFQMIIQVLCNANPDYYIIGGMLKEQMDKQVKQFIAPDPKHDMILQWDMILERECDCVSRNDYIQLHDSGEIPTRVDNFYNQIGEAMGPVCYAGYLLMQELKKEGLSTEWVSKCIEYYQDNWDM